MANRKKTHPNRKTNKQYKPSVKTDASNLNGKSEQKENSHRKRIDWKKIAVNLGVPGFILTLLISYATWTISTIYTLKEEIACVSTELTCYKDFVEMNYGIRLQSVESTNNAETEASG